MTAIEPGMRVKCIKVGTWTFTKPADKVPLCGRVYQVRDVYEDSPDPFSTVEAFLELEGFNPEGWAARQFVPVEEPSIEVFRAILRRLPAPLKEVLSEKTEPRGSVESLC